MVDFAPELLARIPDGDLVDIVQSIQDGAKTPADSLGFSPEVLNSVERTALGYYRGQRFAQAAVIYGFILRLSPNRGSAWRALGACCQSGKFYKMATSCYQAAVRCDPDDVVSRVFWGECLCLSDQIKEGLEILRRVIAGGTKEPRFKPYVTRARAIFNAKGKLPPRLVLLREGKELGGGADEIGEESQREITAQDIREHAELGPKFAEIAKMVKTGRLTLAQVGGFTPNELEGAYTCAYKYSEMGRVTEAMQISGYLALVNPRDSRYYQLTAICWQRMKQYETADIYYEQALGLNPGDARSMCFRGECHLMIGKIDSGIELIKKSIAVAGQQKELADIVKRAGALLAQLKK
jgi:tetratricopeptide (TPR) repeat protein